MTYHMTRHMTSSFIHYRLYIGEDRLTDEIKEHLCVGSEGGVSVREYSAIWDDVKSLTDTTSEGKIWVS